MGLSRHLPLCLCQLVMCCVVCVCGVMVVITRLQYARARNTFSAAKVSWLVTGFFPGLIAFTMSNVLLSLALLKMVPELFCFVPLCVLVAGEYLLTSPEEGERL